MYEETGGDDTKKTSEIVICFKLWRRGLHFDFALAYPPFLFFSSELLQLHPRPKSAAVHVCLSAATGTSVVDSSGPGSMPIWHQPCHLPCWSTLAYEPCELCSRSAFYYLLFQRAQTLTALAVFSTAFPVLSLHLPSDFNCVVARSDRLPFNLILPFSYSIHSFHVLLLTSYLDYALVFLVYRVLSILIRVPGSSLPSRLPAYLLHHAYPHLTCVCLANFPSQVSYAFGHLMI